MAAKENLGSAGDTRPIDCVTYFTRRRAVPESMAKSAEEFLWKFSRNRGDAPNVRGPSDALQEPHFLVAFMQQHEAADVTLDDQIERCAPALDGEIARLLALPNVAEANAKVKRTYQASIPELKHSFRSAPAVLEAGPIGSAFLALAGVTDPCP